MADDAPTPNAREAQKEMQRAATRRALRAGRIPRAVLWGWAALSGAAFAAALGGVVFGAFALILGGLGALRAERKWAVTMATRVLADSFAAISLGRLVDAEAALDALAESAWIPVGTRRLVSIQRGIARVRRGDLPGAREALDDAIAPAPARGEPDATYQITGAVALRAFVHGALGDRDAALADVQRVRASPAAGDDALARASLTEAMILGRTGERDVLRAHLERDHELLHEHCHPRERAIVRALERQVHTPLQTPYRVAEPADSSGDEPTVETWMSRVAPDLALFEEPRRKAATTTAVEDLIRVQPSAGAVAAVQAARTSRAGSLGAWAVVVGLVATGVVVLSMSGGRDGGGVSAARALSGPASGGLAAIVALAMATGLAVAAHRWSARRRDRTRMAGARGRGDAQAGDAIAGLEESRDPAVAAQARLLRATAAEREGRWADVVQETGEGLRTLSSLALRRATGLLAPDLIGLRAFALAALGRTDEAEAELATIAVGYPHYPRARFRVVLVEALRRERFEGALATIDALAGDLPLSVREELLVDLVRSIAAPGTVSQAEAARLRRELSREATRSWIESVAPALLRALERDVDEVELAAARGAPGPRVEVPGGSADGPLAGGAGSEGEEGDRVEAQEEALLEAQAAAEVEAALEDPRHGSPRAPIARPPS